MANVTEAWSEKRRLMAPRVAAVLYGVIAIVTADLILQPGKVTYAEAVLGALLIGFSMSSAFFDVRTGFGVTAGILPR